MVARLGASFQAFTRRGNGEQRSPNPGFWVAELGERSPSVLLPMIGPEFVAHLEDPEHRLGYCRILIRVGGFVE